MTRLLVFSICLSCFGNIARKKDVNFRSEYYKDINLFKMEGVGKITSHPLYPYIEINYVSDSNKIVIYHATERVFFRRNYKRQNNGWMSCYKEIGDTSTATIYEFVLPDKIITLNYSGIEHSGKMSLTEMSVLKNSKKVSYLFHQNIVIKPSVTVPDLTSSKAAYIYTQEIRIVNGILSLSEKRTDMVNYNKKACYQIGDHSYFWWCYLNTNLKGIDCN